MFVASGPGFGSAGEPRGVRGYVHHAVRTDGLPAPGPPRQIIAPGPRHSGRPRTRRVSASVSASRAGRLAERVEKAGAVAFAEGN